MYISGNHYNFEVRLHQLPTGILDLDLFRIEGQQYTGSGFKYEKNKWNREFIKKGEILNFPTGVSGTLFP